jgi:hypothetical protein
VTAENPEAIVDDLLALPFPQEDVRDGDRRSGPGHHVQVLQASQDFWDDRGEDVVEAAEEEIDAAFQALVAALTERWGEPEPIDLSPYLERGLVQRPVIDRLGHRTPPAPDPVPEPINQLCMLSSTMLLWRRPESGRWVALTVAQADPEFPIQLLAAVGEAPIP